MLHRTAKCFTSPHYYYYSNMLFRLCNTAVALHYDIIFVETNITYLLITSEKRSHTHTRKHSFVYIVNECQVACVLRKKKKKKRRIDTMTVTRCTKIGVGKPSHTRAAAIVFSAEF